jgi:hypothetical protein
MSNLVFFVAAEILKAVKKFISSSRDLVSTLTREEINLQSAIRRSKMFVFLIRHHDDGRR